MSYCENHNELEKRIRINENQIVEIKTNMSHLPAQMKDAVEEGFKNHVPASKGTNEADKWYKSQTAILTLMMAVITLISKLVDKL